MAQAPQLRKHEPDPMAALGATVQFGEDGVIHAFLGVDKAPQIERIRAIRRQRFADSHLIGKFCKLVLPIQ
jgi:hypothetical protein